jgi:hypothetical protein
MYVQLPARVMGMASVVLTIGIIAAMSGEVGFRPARLAGIMLRWTLFSWHTLVIVPLALRRYVYSAVTGHKDWRKTSHEGARTDSPG